MALKMKALMEQTQESKSTLLFYVKEGLLPPPQKPKPNLHLYDDECVQRVKFIKYLQQHFSYSLAEIKHIFQNNHLNFNETFEMIITSLQLISGGDTTQWYSQEALLQRTQLSLEELQAYEEAGFLFQRPKGYGEKELQIASILYRAKSLGLDFSLLNHYVQSAKTVAKEENLLGEKLLNSTQESHNSYYELLFELILTLKPYIFNMHTIQTHQANLPKE